MEVSSIRVHCKGQGMGHPEGAAIGNLKLGCKGWALKLGEAFEATRRVLT